MTDAEVVKKLKDYKKLLDEGIFTQEEYDEQKRLILGLSQEEVQSILSEPSNEGSHKLQEETKRLEIEELKKKLEEEKNRNKELKQQLQSQQENNATQDQPESAKPQTINKHASKSTHIINIFLGIFAWVVTVFLSMLALGAFLTPKVIDKLEGLIVLLLIAVICPPISKKISNKFGIFIKYKPYIILGIIFVLFILLIAYQ